MTCAYQFGPFISWWWCKYYVCHCVCVCVCVCVSIKFFYLLQTRNVSSGYHLFYDRR